MEERVPEIRFNGFERPWEKKKLGDTVEVIMGQSPDGNTYSDKPSKYILIQGNADIKDGWVAPRIWTTQITKKCTAGDLIMSVRAPAGAMGKTAFDAVIGRGVAAIKGNEFIFQLLCKMDLDEFWKQVSTGSTFDSINSNTINNTEILIPAIEEQRIIGEYLQQLDTLLTLTQQKLDQLKTFKKACLEKMFPKEGETVPEVRFQGFEGPWEKIIFEEFVKRSSEQSADASLPRVEYEDIVSGIGTINKDLYQKNSHKSGIIFHKGDVLYGKLRPYLQNWLLAFFDGIAVGDFWVLQPQGIDSGFLYRLIQGRKFSDTANQSTGTKMPRADWKLVSKTAFFIPQNVNEQFVIGDFFMNLDSLIISSEQKLGQLKTLKKALLDKMFV